MTTRITSLNPAFPEESVMAALGQVLDPELGIDVVNLGLVYELHIVGADVSIEMTLTTPGCPLHASISEDVQRQVGAVEGIGDVSLEIVWDPPWTPDAMTDVARQALGWML